MFEAHAIGRNSGCRLLIGFEHRRGPAAIEDAAIWRLVDDRLDVEDLAAAFRSEEHTSELQSLMRISYADFCLKQKTNIRRQTIHTVQVATTDIQKHNEVC